MRASRWSDRNRRQETQAGRLGRSLEKAISGRSKWGRLCWSSPVGAIGDREDEQAVVVLDPGSSFGTGQTSDDRCSVFNNWSKSVSFSTASLFLDIGTGSGNPGNCCRETRLRARGRLRSSDPEAIRGAAAERIKKPGSRAHLAEAAGPDRVARRKQSGAAAALFAPI